MSQDYHQGIYGFSNEFERSQQEQQQLAQQQHIAQQIRRDKLRIQDFDPPPPPHLVGIEQKDSGVVLPVYETVGMLSEMFSFPSGGVPTATELLESQISQSYRNPRPPPTGVASAADWFLHRQGMAVGGGLRDSKNQISSINADPAAAMQLFLMNSQQQRSPSPSPSHHHPPSTSSTLHMLLPNHSSSTNSSNHQTFHTAPGAAFGQFTWVPNSEDETNPNEIPGVMEGQGLSLSLSSSLQHLEAVKAEELRIREGGMLCFGQGGGPSNSVAQYQFKNLNDGAATAGSSLHLQGAVVGQNHQLQVGLGSSFGEVNILRISKYAKAAQELLEEFCGVGRSQFKRNKLGQQNHNRNNVYPSSNPSGGAGGVNSSSSSKDQPPLSSADRLEHQRRKVKLLSMLDEVDRRYSHYCEQMQMVVNSFDMVMGFGAATPYTCLAQKAMSRHFRCLKDAIAAQLKHTCELLGEKDGGTSGITKGETPRLKILEQSLRQQRAFHQMGMMQQEAWRPQRGLPDRSVNILRAWLFEHFLHPYPSDADKHLLARQTGLSRNQVMPTVIVVHFDGKWEVSEGNIYKWNPGSKAKFAAIPVDDDICLFENLKSELYRAGKLDETANLRLSYLLELSCNIQPIYLENDHDLKAYLYFGSPTNRPVLQVEIEHVVDASLDVYDNAHGVGIDENVVDASLDVYDNVHRVGIDEHNNNYDDYFDLNIVSLDRNTSEFFEEAHNVDAIHVDHINTTELYDEARDVIVTNCVEVETNVFASNESNVDFNNDTFSFKDGSNLFVGQEFPNRDAVKKELRRISLEACFEFETVKSCQKVYAVKCTVSDCKWRIWTSKIKDDSHAFSIRTYCNTHTCGLTQRRRRIRGASSVVVRDMLVDNFQGHSVPIAPKAVMAMMRNSMNADISYYKAWRGKELADNILKGDPKKSFTLLPCYLHMVEKMNRGSVTDIFVDEENRFKYMFLAFGACVRGYHSMRKVVSLDGTWLKGKYNGVLLVASSQDGNYHQYPLAWGIVDVESTSSWSWFLTKLLEVVEDEDELVIISDRHQGIINAVSSVYRNAHHGHCTWHLSQNLKTRSKKKGATEMFLHIAKIYKQVEFDLAYNEFRKRYPEAAQFLDERDSLDRWTRAYCPKSRYNIMTTNGVESINARLLEERKLPIIALLESLQRLASSWFSRYRNASIAANTSLTPTIEGILRSRFTDAQGMQVFELGRLEFDVRSGRHSAIVDLESKRCTCRVFDIDRIPCAHAIAASWLAKINLYDLCSEYYSNMAWCMAYSETVYPVPEEIEWPRNINFPLVLPPCLEKRVGRRKHKRIPSIGEFSRR